MRKLHSDIGFLTIGLIIIYSISGIVLTYRDTGFLKYERQIERQIPTELDANELGQILHMRDFKVDRVEGDTIYFKNGFYSKSSGVINYKSTELPWIFTKMNSFHKASSRSLIHILNVTIGCCLLFLAISSFWMMKKGKTFKRNVIFISIGIIVSIIFVFII